MPKSSSDGAERPEFTLYEPHPLLALVPAPGEDDLARMQESVAESGVVKPLVLYTDGRGRTTLIDGRTRQEAAFREFRKRVEAGAAPDADNGVPLQPDTWTLTGDTADVYKFIKDASVHKDYRPGQRMAMVVRQHYYEYRRDHHGRMPASLDDELAKTDHVTAETLARRAGSNPYYARICRHLFWADQVLLDAVAAGIIPPPKAEAQLKAKLAGAAPDGDAGPAAPDDPEVVKDAHNQPVPDELADKFRARGGFRVVVNHLEDAVRAAAVVAAQPGADFFDGAAFEKVVRAAVQKVRMAMPYEVCDACSGLGHPKGQRWACKTCGGHGYVCKAVLRAVKAGMTPEGLPVAK